MDITDINYEILFYYKINYKRLLRFQKQRSILLLFYFQLMFIIDAVHFSSDYSKANLSSQAIAASLNSPINILLTLQPKNNLTAAGKTDARLKIMITQPRPNVVTTKAEKTK